MNIRLTLAYDGGPFAGWQVQPGERTVQGELERAIHALTGETVRVLAAGRTDAGVHALGQVANFVTTSGIAPEKWRGALQSQLPPEIAILDSRAAADDFHATYAAKSKRYRYVLRIAAVEDVFLRRYAWRYHGPLDAPAMHEAAQALVGRHDFRCFETEWPNKATSIRTVLDAGVAFISGAEVWSREPLAGKHRAPGHATREGDLFCFEIEADGFLYNMVRAIVGTLVYVGRGKCPASTMHDIIAAQDRGLAGETAPAHGLYLVGVNYDIPITGDSDSAESV